MHFKMKYVLTWALALSVVMVEVQSSIKVCKRYKDFYVPGSKNCWRNDYDVLDVMGIAKTWGFKTENYTLTTEDGYIISVFRVYNKITQKTPMMLGHASGTNPVNWLFAGNNSLAYVLGNKGYDVWMISYRGTIYSKKHVSLSYKDHKYWDFTFHQMGIYDLKSAMDLVYNTTKQKAIYVGLSMGTTVSYVYCSMLPEECQQKLSGVISFAAVGYLLGAQGLYPILWQPFIWPIVREVTYTFFHGELFKRTWFTKTILKTASLTPLGNYIAMFGLGFVFGFDLKSLDSSYIPVVLNTFQDTIGVEVYSHYSQIYTNKSFNLFNYGKKKNMKLYGQEYPPPYPLDKIPVPVTMFIGKADFLATLSATSKTYSLLNPKSQCGYHIVEDPDWNHADFVTAKNLPDMVHKALFEKIHQLEQGKCG